MLNLVSDLADSITRLRVVFDDLSAVNDLPEGRLIPKDTKIIMARIQKTTAKIKSRKILNPLEIYLTRRACDHLIAECNQTIQGLK